MRTLLLVGALTLLPVDDEPVGTVGDMEVGREAFGAWLVERYGPTYTGEFLREQLVLRAAEEQGALPSDEQVQLAWERERQSIIDNVHHGSEEDWLHTLRMRGQDPVAYAERRRGALRAELALEELARRERSFSEEQIRRRYRDVYGELGERQSLRVLWFDMWNPGGQPAHTGEGATDMEALRAAARERAEEAAEAWRSGTPFEELRERSDPVESDFVHDGELEVYRRMLLGPEVERALSQVDEVGTIVGPVETRAGGFYVLRVTAREEATYEEARGEMLELLHEAPLTTDELGSTERALQERYPIEILLR